MNKTVWKDALTNTPENSVEVSEQLHQDIMRAVRLSEPASRKPVFKRVIPAWGVAAFALVLLAVFFYPTRTATVLPLPEPGQGLSQSQAPIISLEQLAGSLVAFSRDVPEPEQELRKELERLKSDLERFDFRS
jgi:hypothetical protein